MLAKLKLLAKRLLLLAVVCALMALVLEVLVRWLAPVDTTFYDNAGSQRDLEWRHNNPRDNPFGLVQSTRFTKPGSVSRMCGHEVRINAAGMRQDREFAFEKPPGALRVMLVGDSVTFSNVGFEQSIGEHLRRMLSDRLKPRPVEVPTFACPGWGWFDYVDIAERALPKYQLDHIVVGFVMNDILVAPFVDPDTTPPPQPPNETLYDLTLGRAMAIDGPIRAMMRRSALVTRLHWAFKPLLARGRDFDEAIVHMAEPQEAMHRRMQWARQPLAKLKQLAAKQGAQLTVVIYPYLMQFDDQLGKQTVEKWYGRPFDPQLLQRRPQQELLRACEQEGVRCIDATPTLAAQPDHGKLYFATPEGRIDYIHFSEEGNRVVAALLADALTATSR